MKKLLCLATACTAMAAAGGALAASVKERTTYFMVRGSTLDELDHDLNRRGPFVAETGLRHPGATEVKFDGKVSYRRVPDGCEVASTDLSLQLMTTLPKWQPSKRASPQTVLIWRTLEADIIRHEKEHANIAKLWMKKMESAIRNLRVEPTCEAMEQQVNETSAFYLRQHEQAQTEFDTIEGREVNWRLRRALQRNIQGAAAGR